MPYQLPDPLENHLASTSTALRRQRTSTAPPPPKQNPKLLSFFLKAIIMTLITTLFFLFLGLAAIILLHLCVAGGLVHRRRRHHHRTTSLASSSNDGLCPCEIKKLPRFKYSDRDAPKGANLNDCCAVCLDNFRQGQWCRKLVECGHVFHRNCVDTWLVKARACPVCRSRVRARSGCPNSTIDGREFNCLWDFGRSNDVRVW